MGGEVLDKTSHSYLHGNEIGLLEILEDGYVYGQLNLPPIKPGSVRIEVGPWYIVDDGKGYLVGDLLGDLEDNTINLEDGIFQFTLPSPWKESKESFCDQLRQSIRKFWRFL